MFVYRHNAHASRDSLNDCQMALSAGVRRPRARIRHDGCDGARVFVYVGARDARARCERDRRALISDAKYEFDCAGIWSGHDERDAQSEEGSAGFVGKPRFMTDSARTVSCSSAVVSFTAPEVGVMMKMMMMIIILNNDEDGDGLVSNDDDDEVYDKNEGNTSDADNKGKTDNDVYENNNK